MIENIMIQLESDSIHTLVPHRIRGVLVAKPQCRGSWLKVKGSMAQPCLFRNPRKSVTMGVIGLL